MFLSHPKRTGCCDANIEVMMVAMAVVRDEVAEFRRRWDGIQLVPILQGLVDRVEDATPFQSGHTVR